MPPFFWPVGHGHPPGDAPAKWTVVGHDEGTWFVLADDGSLVSRAPGSPARFVNSSPQAFSESLEALEGAWRLRLTQDDSEATQAAHELHGRLRGIDPSAIERPDSWWALVLEQMDSGLL